MGKKILGLHVHGSQSSACIIDDGEVVAGAAEERFNRIKQSRAFPNQAIAYCLKQCGLSNPAELDAIAVAWNPANNMRNINSSGFTEWRRYDPEWLYIIPNNLLSPEVARAFTEEASKFEIGINTDCPIYFVDHHRSHAGHAVFQSTFPRGAVAILDEYGEFYSATLGRFRDKEIEIMRQIPYPHSLGVFYAAITEYLGFRPNSDEWKVMGAAAYGDPARFRKALQQVIFYDEQERAPILDQRYVEHANLKRAGYTNERLARLLGIPPRTGSGELEDSHYDLAASAQEVFELLLFKLLNDLAAETGEKILCASGGSFMNSLANGKIIANTPFENLFIPYAAADNGGSVGAALWVHHCIQDAPRRIPALPSTPFLGPAFSNQEIEERLRRYKVPFTPTDDPARLAAEQVVKGRLVGWFQGAMEFGERALGNRSILADPRDAKMKDKINSAVKYREAFRPFAPSILEEKVGEFFDIPKDVLVPYMEQVYPILPDKRSLIPAIVHADGTGRLQTVNSKMNPLYHQLISHFHRITGVPLLLNTSFNVQGEPIVCTPEDALRTYFTCGLDLLIIGGCVLDKEAGPERQLEGIEGQNIEARVPV